MPPGETFKQEMPPVGGYRRLNFERTFAKRFLTLKKAVTYMVVTQAMWLYFYRIARREQFLEELEKNSTNIALEPCLTAERDREYMRQLRRNREEERELMKNVKGWEVGKLFNEPVFYTYPEKDVQDPSLSEYYAHTRLKYLLELYHFEFYH